MNIKSSWVAGTQMSGGLARHAGSSSSSGPGSKTAPDSECAPKLAAFSSTQTLKSGLSCFSLMAQAKPAGPAPTMATSYSMTSRFSIIKLTPKTGEPFARRSGHEGIYPGLSPYRVGTTMLTGHGRRLPGWPRDLGMARARTPTLFFGGSVRPPAGFTLGKEGCKAFLSLGLYPQFGEPRGHIHRGHAALTGRLLGVADQGLRRRLGAGRAFQNRINDGGTGCIQFIGRYRFVRQANLLQGRRTHRFGGQKVAQRRAFTDFGQHKWGNDGRNDA